MGIDIYLEWKDMRKKEKKAQICGFDTGAGRFGYLREAYHGGPYPSKMLVREAFEAPKCRAKIPAAVMKKRLTSVTEPAVAGEEAHAISMIMAEVVKRLRETGQMPKDGEILQVTPDVVKSGKTTPMTVEEAVRERCRIVYPDMSANDVENLVNSYRGFVALAEQKEKETGEPCTVYASY